MESAGGQDLPRGTEDKSDKLKEDYQDRKRGKENSSVTKRCPFLATPSDQSSDQPSFFIPLASFSVMIPQLPLSSDASASVST